MSRLAASISRCLGENDGVTAPLGAEAGPLQVESSRPTGTVWLLDRLWKLLGIDTGLAQAIGGHRFRTAVERALFALVASRAIAPGAKLAAGEWATRDAVIPGLPGLGGSSQALRAMDLLIEGGTEGAVQEAVFFAAARPSQPRSRPDLFRHHQHLLRT
ncbi:hypothetical protein ABT187_49695, partial [Streptomyces sp. NPDC001817]